MIPYRIENGMKRKILELNHDGLSITDIANEVGVAVSITLSY